jgi:uncharacterized membrane protein
MGRFGSRPGESFFQYAVPGQHHAAISAAASGARIISGIAKIGLGILLLFQQWSLVAGWGLMLVAVFPANIHMALHPEPFKRASPASLWLRLPLQGVLIG